MHLPYNIFKNTRLKLLKPITAIWFNKSALVGVYHSVKWSYLPTHSTLHSKVLYLRTGISRVWKDSIATSSENTQYKRTIFSSVIFVVYLRTKYTNTCRKSSQNTTIFVTYKMLVYTQISQPTTCFGLF